MRSHIVPLIAILFCSCTMAQEMLQNPGFEAGPGEGVPTGWANAARFTLLTLALAWSLRFEWRLAGLRTQGLVRRLGAVALVAAGLLPFCWAWVLFFVRW